MSAVLEHVGLISADPWDGVWRRNQHLAAQLVRLGLVRRLTFVNPPTKLGHRGAFAPEPGIRVVTPHLLLPRHRGGIRLAAWETRRRYLDSIDALWINDAVLGVRCLRPSVNAVYDVTDDWRTANLSARDRDDLVAAEDVLAQSVRTIVCSRVLRDRWAERYGIIPPVIHNGVDAEAHADADARELEGEGPHLMYVGTLHDDRLDVDLLINLARVGSVHLVGPNHLSPSVCGRLEATPRMILHGPTPSAEVPGWMASADVLVAPHRVTEFTLSLDAIKSFEYLASGKPVVATPTSGFQELKVREGIHVVEPRDFLAAAERAVAEPADREKGRATEHDWSNRAREFAEQLQLGRDVGA
jgi:glycosyltransferase involved in cell wall biosynthesis